MHESRHLSRVKLNALLTAGIILLYALRVAGTMPAFWLLLVALVWPLADRLSRRGVEHILAAAGDDRGGRSADPNHGLSRARITGGADHRRTDTPRLGLGDRYRESDRAMRR